MDIGEGEGIGEEVGKITTTTTTTTSDRNLMKNPQQDRKSGVRIRETVLCQTVALGKLRDPHKDHNGANPNHLVGQKLTDVHLKNT